MDKLFQWVPRGLALGAFGLYVWAAAPGVYWLDSGELSAAAWAMGSPHPTGFPIFCILGKLASLFPIGEIAFRINLMSAACAALTVFWVVQLVLGLGRRDIPSLVGSVAAGATLALSFTFFRQATVAEVYAPNAAALAGTLVLFSKMVKAKPWHYAGLLGIAFGIGVGVHITYLLVVPVSVVYLAVSARRAKWPFVVPVLAMVVFVSSYAYLPLRSSTGRTTTADWGHPRTLANLADHMSAGRPRRAFAAAGGIKRSDAAMRSTNLAIIKHNATTFLGEIADQLGPATLLAALVGFFAMLYRRRTRWVGLAVVGVAVGDTMYSFWLNPMGMVDLQNGVPAAVAICVAAGIGVAIFARAVGRGAPFIGGTATLACVLPVALVSWVSIWAAASGDAPRAWSEAAFDDILPRGIALVQNDSVAAGMIFLNTVEGARPDVAVLVRQHLVGDWERTIRVLERSTDQQANPPATRSLAAIAALARPIGWEMGYGSPPGPLLPGVPLARVANTALRGQGQQIDQAFDRLHGLTTLPGANDRAARRVFAAAAVGLGRLAYRDEDIIRAAHLFEIAIKLRPNHVAGHLNLGTTLARQRKYDQSILHAQSVLANDPNHTGALLNLARWLLRAKRDKDAHKTLMHLLAIRPNDVSALAFSALIYLREGHADRANESIKRAMELDPRNRDLVDLLRQMQAQRK